MRRFPRQCVLVTTCNGSLNREWGSGNNGLLTISSLWHLQVKFLCPCLLRILIFPIFFSRPVQNIFPEWFGLVWKEFGGDFRNGEFFTTRLYILKDFLPSVPCISFPLYFFLLHWDFPPTEWCFFKYFIRDFPFKTMTWMFVYDFTCKWLLCRADSIS